MLFPVLTGALALAWTALPASALVPPAPAPLPALTDPFYSDPGNLSLYAPGDVVRTRSVQTTAVDASLARTEQVVYRTTNTQNLPSWSVASIFIPTNQSAAGKIFSLQLAEDSANQNCAPSQWVLKGQAAAFVYGADTGVYLSWALRNGWTSVIPDHEGPNSGFLSGHEEGQAVLDAIRAARNASSLPQDTPVGLYGYSGGAHATAWAINLAASYASDIRIAGASYGGTPADPASIARYVDNTQMSGFLPAALAGALNTQPESTKSQLLDACSPAFSGVIQGATEQCGLAVLAEYSDMSIAGLCNETMGERLWQPSPTPFWSLLANESLLTNVSSLPIAHPDYPQLIQHGGADKTIPIGQVEAYVEQQCAGGAKIQWVSWPGQDHLPTIAASMPATMQYFIELFNESLPKVQCGQHREDVLTLGSPDLGAVVGDSAARAIKAFAGSSNPSPTPSPNSESGITPTSSPSGTATPSSHPNGADLLSPSRGWLVGLSFGALVWVLCA